MKIKLRANKKGVSSIFMAVFILLITFVLSVSLFTAIGISGKSTLEVLEQEREKQQEGIFLQIGSIKFSNNIIQSIRVNNTGSIPVQISAVYINAQFLKNPELLIKPQESAEIPVSNLAIPYLANRFNELIV